MIIIIIIIMNHNGGISATGLFSTYWRYTNKIIIIIIIIKFYGITVVLGSKFVEMGTRLAVLPRLCFLCGRPDGLELTTDCISWSVFQFWWLQTQPEDDIVCAILVHSAQL